MKLEKLSKGNFIKTSIIVLVVISIFGVIFINKSKAKYRVTQSIQVVSGEVNYKVADLNVLALYKQKTEGNTDDNNYESITDVPSGNYVVNTSKSYCTIIGNDTQLKNIPMKYEDNKVYIGISKKGTKCYVYLDIDPKKSATELLTELKVNSISDGCPAYEDAPSITSAETSKSLLCKGKDDLGDTYYYRGAVKNNWVKIGNTYWRIIRFNGNGSIRLIYSGSGSPVETGEGTQISTSAYNNSKNDLKYVKFMYDNSDSTIKGVLDNWYNNNLKTYANKFDGIAGFCNDADMYNSTEFNPYNRIDRNKKPTLKCETPKTNLFTTSEGINGNQKLINPIGLITADEANFGGAGASYSTGYYLYTNQDYWTMTPGRMNSGVGVWAVYSHGYLSYAMSNLDRVDSKKGVRPVINLKSSTTFELGGDGNMAHPYEVVI